MATEVKSFDAIDTEMTSPLTSIDNDSTRSFTPDKMDAFHSARERDQRIRGNGTTPFQTPAQNMGPGIDANANAWRRQSFCGPTYAGPEGFTPITMVRPGSVYPTSDQINSAFAYGIRRADGSYTRLLPADELPDLIGVPQHQGPEGLIILPEVHHGSPKPDAPIPMIPNKIVSQLPQLSPPIFSLNNPQGHFRRPGDQTQLAIDSIVASAVAPPISFSTLNNAMVPMGGPPMRREKVYCDKWLHSGTCAFMQVGCKYKHIMPEDREIQKSLGLPNGPPLWYRKEHNLPLSSPSGSNGQAEASGTTPTNGTSRTSQPWRRKDVASFSFPSSIQGGANGRGMSLLARPIHEATITDFGTADRRSSFGPIGPPHNRRLTNSSSGGSMNRSLPLPEEEENSGDSKMQFNGRARGYTNGQDQVRGYNNRQDQVRGYTNGQDQVTSYTNGQDQVPGPHH
ncbi:hypothetical protein NHQ30_008628 [Ciborinia camelliae]|nr:hypothetical protein NHQ30_008628 [Ciborinia camelliae]